MTVAVLFQCVCIRFCTQTLIKFVCTSIEPVFDLFILRFWARFVFVKCTYVLFLGLTCIMHVVYIFAFVFIHRN